MALLGVEIRRDLARRLTRVLIGIALVVTVVVGVAVFANQESLEDDPAAPPGTVLLSTPNDARFLTAAWPEDDPGRGYLVTPAVFLAITAFIAGASMIGAEWKAGTFTNLLTWEPRRARVLGAKFGAAGFLAAVIAAALLVFFLAAFLPTVLVKGSTDDLDGESVRWLASGIGRMAGIAGMAAVFGAAIAMVGRNTSAAIGVAFAYFMVFENLIRGLRPQWQRWLITENTALWLMDGRLDIGFDRDPTLAGVTLLGYAAGAVLVAWALFARRDVAGAS